MQKYLCITKHHSQEIKVSQIIKDAQNLCTVAKEATIINGNNGYLVFQPEHST